MKPSTFLIKSSQNSSFGTAFCIAKDDKGSFLVTCTHVVEACGDKYLEVNSLKAKLLYLGSSRDIDLAVIFVEGLFDVSILKLSTQSQQTQTSFELDGFKPHKNGTYLQRPLQGVINNISQIHSNTKTITTYELIIENSYSIEKGYSGSAIIVNGQVVGVATDRNSNGKQAYAIPIIYLKDIWLDIPQELFDTGYQSRNDFSREVFDILESKPLLLFSADSYNHTDYIRHIRDEAVDRFTKPYILDINCSRFSRVKDIDSFFSRVAKRVGLGSEVEDSYDFQDKLEDFLVTNRPLKSLIFVTNFEKLDSKIRDIFAEILRDVYTEHRDSLQLIIFGGKNLIKLKYNNHEHSYFNIFQQQRIPPPILEDWRKRFKYLTDSIYRDIVSITGGHSLLSEYCFGKGVKNIEESKRVIYNSYLKSELFKAYDKEALCRLLDKEYLGDFHPYYCDELLYRLYWNNLIIEKDGKFVWRSGFIVELGKGVLGCM